MNNNDRKLPAPEVVQHIMNFPENEEERKKEIDKMVNKRNEILISMGYEIDSDGKITPPSENSVKRD